MHSGENDEQDNVMAVYQRFVRQNWRLKKEPNDFDGNNKCPIKQLHVNM